MSTRVHTRAIILNYVSRRIHTGLARPAPALRGSLDVESSKTGRGRWTTASVSNYPWPPSLRRHTSPRSALSRVTGVHRFDFDVIRRNRGSIYRTYDNDRRTHTCSCGLTFPVLGELKDVCFFLMGHFRAIVFVRNCLFGLFVVQIRRQVGTVGIE